jgi:hypothetical protein
MNIRSKQRKIKPATLRMDADWREKKMELDANWMAKQMSAVATMMWTVTERMDDFDWDGFSPKMKPRVRILAMHAAMLDLWADEVREQAKKRGPNEEA